MGGWENFDVNDCRDEKKKKESKERMNLFHYSFVRM